MVKNSKFVTVPRRAIFAGKPGPSAQHAQNPTALPEGRALILHNSPFFVARVGVGLNKTLMGKVFAPKGCHGWATKQVRV